MVSMDAAEGEDAGSAPVSTPGASDELKTLPVAEVMTRLGTSPDGLSQVDAQQRLTEYGPNEVVEHTTNPLLKFLGYFWGPIPWMITVSSVGAGDSMLGGVIAGLLRGKSILESVRLGVACGAGTSMMPGTQLFRAKDLPRLVAETAMIVPNSTRGSDFLATDDGPDPDRPDDGPHPAPGQAPTSAPETTPAKPPATEAPAEATPDLDPATDPGT